MRVPCAAAAAAKASVCSGESTSRTSTTSAGRRDTSPSGSGNAGMRSPPASMSSRQRRATSAGAGGRCSSSRVCSAKGWASGSAAPTVDQPADPPRTPRDRARAPPATTYPRASGSEAITYSGRGSAAPAGGSMRHRQWEGRACGSQRDQAPAGASRARVPRRPPARPPTPAVDLQLMQPHAPCSTVKSRPQRAMPATTASQAAPSSAGVAGSIS